MTKPLLSRVFKNVSFPTAQWSSFFDKEESRWRNAGQGDLLLFNNSRTGFEYRDCGKDYLRIDSATSFGIIAECVEVGRLMKTSFAPAFTKF